MEQHTYLKPLPYKQSTPLNEKYRVLAIWRVVSMHHLKITPNLPQT
ncbi:hypothetical protein [Mastigocladopsis repens]|nr:hypothetical protein [Mastigocladopsis repens]